ncbi:MAG: right-handed parallel beta-helix repeat-containing protein [Chitinispirillia bacterium]|nr:right-handed parallel beta-helix repeat-containing protein [Chitinispirillia bacterium]MCL2241378.1 right-handed parallel beta-helix repeat-containing protein [Chitinispirillia bacterium]
MFDTDDPRNIWVSADAADDGLGTHESPFSEVSSALKKAAPGQTVILMPGNYGGDLTIDTSGEEKAPVYITAQAPGEAVVDRGCWYFYDASDLVVSGLTFKNARHGAVSVMGKCLRNRFHGIKFIDCGTDSGKASCTFYFGGAGGRFNIVEDCEFSRAGIANKDNVSTENTAVGLMISDGGENAPLTNHIIRNNKFCGYDRAIIAGSDSGAEFESGHCVDLNRISGCAGEGIVIKCADVQARGNEIRDCGGTAIVLDGGEGSEVEGNLISGCGGGIMAGGISHTITGNHITK